MNKPENRSPSQFLYFKLQQKYTPPLVDDSVFGDLLFWNVISKVWHMSPC
jgi:hypothetical protein